MWFAAARALFGLGAMGIRHRYWRHGLKAYAGAYLFKKAGDTGISWLQRRHNRRNRSLARMAYFKPRRWRRRYWRGYSRRRIYRRRY